MLSPTEQDSHYNNLEMLSIQELLLNINQEDRTVPMAVSEAIPQIEALVNVIVRQMELGGRLFYIGAGTSGRLGIVDASECPPTFGVPHDWVIGLMAGGDAAMRKAVEFAEDDENQAWLDMQEYNLNIKDVVIGIAASGRTPYVLGGLKRCNEEGIATGCITCVPGSALVLLAKYPVEVKTGPEVITGSTRMKAGTAQKLVLNMISTATMIKLGRVKGNKMVDMQLSNHKLIERGSRMVQEALPHLSLEAANELLLTHGSVRKAIDALNK